MDYRIRRPDCLLAKCRSYLFGNLTVSEGVLLPDEPTIFIFREIVNVCLDELFEALVV